jgi:hypothetical protein
VKLSPGLATRIQCLERLLKQTEEAAAAVARREAALAQREAELRRKEHEATRAARGPPSQPDGLRRVLRTRELEAFVRLKKRNRIDQMVVAATFPKPVKLSARTLS